MSANLVFAGPKMLLMVDGFPAWEVKVIHGGGLTSLPAPRDAPGSFRETNREAFAGETLAGCRTVKRV